MGYKCLILISFISFVFADEFECLPYGTTAALGYYYTYYSLGNDQLTISFNTIDICPKAFVNISLISNSSNFTVKETVTMDIKVDNKTWVYERYVQKASFSNLIPGESYQYFVSGGNLTAGPYQITVPKKSQSSNETKSVVFFGDFDSNRGNGNKTQYTYEWFINQTKNRSGFEMLVLLGDIAYNLEDDKGLRGDNFFRNLSTFAPYWPLMYTPGNHDIGLNREFRIVRKKFYSPELKSLNTPQNYINFYGFDLGYAHFINFNPYWIVYDRNATLSESTHNILYSAMKEELKKAQANRGKVPWIIIYSHYPMYCSGFQDIQCSRNQDRMSAFENLFNEYRVDLYINAHQHSYERDAPTYHNKTAKFRARKGDVNQTYITDPSATIYITDGAAGNFYFMPSVPYNATQYTVAQSVKPGVGILHIYNKTHLGFEQIAVQNHTQEDVFYLIKTQSLYEDGQIRSKAVWISVGVGVGVVLIFVFSLCFIYIRRRKRLIGSLKGNVDVFEDS